MDIRIVIFILVLGYYFILGKRRNTVRSKNKLVFFSCILLALYSGLRHISVGPDTPYYYQNFLDVLSFSWSDIISRFFVGSTEFRDPGYNLLVKVFTSIIPVWQLFLLALAFLYYYAMGKLWKRYISSSEGVLLAVMLVLSLFGIISLSGIRQQITIAISMMMILYVEDKKWKVVVPVVLIGALVHISLLFFLAFIPFHYVRKGHYRFYLGLSIVMMPIIAFSAQTIVSFMAGQLDNDYYMNYAEHSSMSSAYLYVIMCSLISIYLLANYNQLLNAPTFLSSALVLMTITVPLILQDGAMIRIGQYFTIYMMLSLPWVLDTKKNNHILYDIMVIALLFFILKSQSEYHFFWESVPGFSY